LEADALAAALSAEADDVGVPLAPAQIAALLRFRSLIAQWTSRARLTALTDPLQAVRLHLVDSLLCLRAVAFPQGAAVIDVGSGAGLPGIPLAIAREDLHLTLLEPAERKAAFLELAVGELGLRCDVVAARAESAGHDGTMREHFDIAVARAVAPLPRLVELTLPFVRVSGSAVLLKGPSVHAELGSAQQITAALGGTAPRTVQARLVGGERRVVIVVEKVSSTPDLYPRKASRRPHRR
jgi:16S rRNA (guanine527-N7)-methyltransferase